MAEVDELIEKFKMDVAKFSGHYPEFLVIVKRKDGNLNWKSSDTTWVIGAAHRYLRCVDEQDRVGERHMLEGE